MPMKKHQRTKLMQLNWSFRKWFKFNYSFAALAFIWLFLIADAIIVHIQFIDFISRKLLRYFVGDWINYTFIFAIRFYNRHFVIDCHKTFSSFVMLLLLLLHSDQKHYRNQNSTDITAAQHCVRPSLIALSFESALIHRKCINFFTILCIGINFIAI